MADKTTDAIKLNLRLPKHLHKRLKQQARRNNVSLNTEIVNQLEGSGMAADTRLTKHLTATLKPLVDEAVELAVQRVTGSTRASRLLDWLQPRDEAELNDKLVNWFAAEDEDTEFIEEVHRTFRERQAAKEPHQK